MSDTRQQLELAVLETALIKILKVAQTHHPSYTTLGYIAEQAQSAMRVVARSEREAAKQYLLRREAEAPPPVEMPANVIPFDPKFRHKDPPL